jgi:hypothetical protein
MPLGASEAVVNHLEKHRARVGSPMASPALSPQILLRLRIFLQPQRKTLRARGRLALAPKGIIKRWSLSTAPTEVEFHRVECVRHGA